MPLLVITTIVFGILIIIISPLGGDRWCGWFSSMIGQIWGWLIVRATLLPVTVNGRENIEPGKSYVIVANHQGCYDIFLIIGFIRKKVRWMMKASLMKIPFLGRASRISGHIAVDNTSPSHVHETYVRACKSITNGVSLVIFPEGRRSTTGEMGEFRRGAFLIADKLQLPVVPITIDGTFEVMPRDRDFKFARWHPLTMTIHPPIMPISQSADDVKYLMEESRKAIRSAQTSK